MKTLIIACILVGFIIGFLFQSLIYALKTGKDLADVKWKKLKKWKNYL